MARPVVCMVTERSRLGLAERSTSATLLQALVRRIESAARHGVHLVQVRERDLEGGSLLSLVHACVEAVRQTPARILVNERVDVALAAGAHGVHLRGDSMPASRIRMIAPRGFLIGRSVHSVAEAVTADEDGGLDYLLFGPVFPTCSKPGAGGTGAASLASVVRAVRLPVLAIGGVTPATAVHVAHAGAAGFAAIGMFADGAEADAAAAALAARGAFDSPYTVP
jgi:thiamine-phosphate pyrophosphorylase